MTHDGITRLNSMMLCMGCYGQYPVNEVLCSPLEAVDLKATGDSLVGAHDGFSGVPPGVHKGSPACFLRRPVAQILRLLIMLVRDWIAQNIQKADTVLWSGVITKHIFIATVVILKVRLNLDLKPR